MRTHPGGSQPPFVARVESPAGFRLSIDCGERHGYAAPQGRNLTHQELAKLSKHFLAFMRNQLRPPFAYDGFELRTVAERVGIPVHA